MKNFITLLFSLSLFNVLSAQEKSNRYVYANNSHLALPFLQSDLALQSSPFISRDNYLLPGLPVTPYEQFREHEMKMYSAMAGLQTNVVGLDYDVKYYRLNLRLNPDTSVGKYVRGSVTTYFKTVQAALSIIKFDFASTLACDSVYYHGIKLSAGSKTEDVDTLKITIPAIAAAGTLDSITVFYKGTPPTIPDFGGATGFVKSTHGSPVQNYIYTLSEPYGASTWWPCKSRVASDKADSVDLVISTPLAFKVAANGIVASETTSATNRVTWWKHRYPISSYQVALAVANYVQYPASPTMVDINGTSMPFYNYLFPETNTPTAQLVLDRTTTMLTTFTDKFGDYPFKKEKYGHYTFGFGGGMEHNTFSGMNFSTYNATSDWSVIAHELGHQWFGASVTCASWSDIWVNESFARYSEVICAEFAPAVTAGSTALTVRSGIKSSATNAGNQVRSIFQSDTTSITTIFSPSVYIYERGAMVVSMLRTLLGDTKFFQAIKNYQADPLLKFSNALTEDVQRHIEAVSSLDLSEFFSDWIYNRGYANYSTATWNNSGTQLILKLPQTTLYSGISHFDMPLAIRVQGGASDTTIIVYDKSGMMNYVNNGVLNSTGSNIIQFNLSFVPTTITFDAFNQVLATGSFVKDPSITILAANLLNFSGIKETSQSRLWWTIDKAADYASFQIERSNDGVAFEAIGIIPSAVAPHQTAFAYTDKGSGNGTTYYRLKITQLNGVVIYSKILALTSSANVNEFTITPNPASEYILIKSKSGNKKVDIKIYDAAGKMVKKLLKQSLSDNNPIRIGLAGLSDGSYFVEIQSSNAARFTRQITIVR